MTINFGYDKRQVVQALRYHFISKIEIRIMLITVNLFAMASFILYFAGKIDAMAFLVSSLLWFVLMISFWFVLPGAVYKRAITFKHTFSMHFSDSYFSLEHDRGSKSWDWNVLKYYLESPHFFHLYFDSRSFLLVPKSGCTDSDQLVELRKLIKEHVKKK